MGQMMEVEMKIRGLMMDPVTNTPIVILKDSGSDTVLPIWVGVYEANAIALEIERMIRDIDLQAARHVSFNARDREPVSPDRRRAHRHRDVVVDQRKARQVGGTAQALLDQAW